MAKVVDAARVTTPSNTVWRTCTGCGLTNPLADGVDLCKLCAESELAPRTVAEIHAATGWDIVYRYASLVGRIDAWAEQIPDVSDAERLDNIRHALKTLHPLRPGREVQ
ncbi:hypothetical protein [Actinoplanes utahensis]|uniref:Uncharacterized protein n=1 Tax=Actinoplanes utahensis TaxID=1869 RepID=A0A0A6UDI3_ACTUT|nr:hypothetical protein [Actinoplanes utahensis]KHD74110.1 hypothetical protein MB27_30645 [Actinoplanes utahensis]GIF30835.1 hypothetical protein Aut01nite_38210 [Actinoplanes utahensis]